MILDSIREDLLYVTGQKTLPENKSLVAVLSKLDEVSRGEDLPERLEHYLSRRSYIKALEWLDNPDLPHKA
jgi:hypothetical protein